MKLWAAWLLFFLVLITRVSVWASAGDLDQSFGTGGIVTTGFPGQDALGRAVVVQPDNKLIVAGETSVLGTAGDFAIARYNSDGSLDGTFAGGPVTTHVGDGLASAVALVIQPDRKLVAAGTAASGNQLVFALVRYTRDGSLDTSFGMGGTVLTPIGSSAGATAIVLQPDGKLVTAGYASAGDARAFALARYKPDGALDGTFGTGGTVTTQIQGTGDAAVMALVRQPDGKFVAAGTWSSMVPSLFPSADGVSQFALARYNSDGSLDPSFGDGGTVTTQIGATFDSARALVLQPDGRLVVAGISQDLAAAYFALARYNPDGSLDHAFGSGGAVKTSVGPSNSALADALVLQSDGKVVAGGLASAVGESDFALVRYNSDGSLDGTFGDAGTVTTSLGLGIANATALALQPDDKIVAAGYSFVGTANEFSLVRYDTDITPRRLAYYALGDSIASGHGLPRGTGQILGTCQTSPDAYPEIVYQSLKGLPQLNVVLRQLACTGATSAVSQPPRPSPLTDLPQQIETLGQELQVFRPELILVSITAGADDFDFSDELTFGTNICATPAFFRGWVDVTSQGVQQHIERALRVLLTEQPELQIVVTDYFNPFNNSSVYFHWLRTASRFPDSPINEMCHQWSDQELYNRTERAIQQLNNALLNATNSIVSAPGIGGRLHVVSVQATFTGHGAARPNCGDAAPDIEDSFIQYPEFPLLPTSPSDIPIVLLELPGLVERLHKGNDCIHPNQVGATTYARGTDSVSGVFGAFKGLLGTGVPGSLAINAPLVDRIVRADRVALGDCCVSGSDPGCSAPSCQACVCARDAFCCETGWDVYCSDTAASECAASCPCGPPVPTNTPPPTPTPGGACCAAHAGSACDDAQCQTCVCGIDPQCCTAAWDDFCVFDTARRCAGSCACARPTPTNTPMPTPGGDCCQIHAGPSCHASICQACVCGRDQICCSATWDDFCINTATAQCAAECACAPTLTPSPVPTNSATSTASFPTGTSPTATPTLTPGGDCCLVHGGPGCDAGACQACICGADSFCCVAFWDQYCGERAGTGCRTSCPCAPPSSTSTPSFCPTAMPSTSAVRTVTPSTPLPPSPTPVHTPPLPTTTGTSVCTGDCDHSGKVTVNELVTMVNVALGNAALSACAAGDANSDGAITIGEIVTAVSRALNGCNG